MINNTSLFVCVCFFFFDLGVASETAAARRPHGCACARVKTERLILCFFIRFTPVCKPRLFIFVFFFSHCFPTFFHSESLRKPEERMVKCVCGPPNVTRSHRTCTSCVMVVAYQIRRTGPPPKGLSCGHVGVFSCSSWFHHPTTHLFLAYLLLFVGLYRLKRNSLSVIVDGAFAGSTRCEFGGTSCSPKAFLKTLTDLICKCMYIWSA